MTELSGIFSSGYIIFFEFCTDGIHPFGDGREIMAKVFMEQSNPCN